MSGKTAVKKKKTIRAQSLAERSSSRCSSRNFNGMIAIAAVMPTAMGNQVIERQAGGPQKSIAAEIVAT
jgi:hypothetical protein